MNFDHNLDLYSQIHMAELQRDADYRARIAQEDASILAATAAKPVTLEVVLDAAFDDMDAFWKSPLTSEVKGLFGIPNVEPPSVYQ